MPVAFPWAEELLDIRLSCLFSSVKVSTSACSSVIFDLRHSISLFRSSSILDKSSNDESSNASNGVARAVGSGTVCFVADMGKSEFLNSPAADSNSLKAIFNEAIFSTNQVGVLPSFLNIGKEHEDERGIQRKGQ